MIKVSIIVPVYNVKDYLERAIKSLINQTLKEIEIILIDDGSTDGSQDICDKYSQEDDRVVVIHQKNGGVSAARNNGISIARGEYIGFMDSDDYVESDMYEVLYNNAIQNCCQLSAINAKNLQIDGTFIIEKERTNKVYVWDNKTALKNFLTRKYFNVCIWSKIIHRDVCKNISFEVGRKIGEDEFYSFESFFYIDKACYQDTDKYIWFMRPGSALRSGFNKGYLDTLYFTEKMLSMVKDEYPDLIEYAEIQKLYSNIVVLNELNGHKKARKEFSVERKYMQKYLKKFSNKKAKSVLSNFYYKRFFLLKHSMWLHGLLKDLKK